MSIRVQVAAMQWYWLELVAGLDYMEIHQPVMNGKAQHDDTFGFNCLMGTFTLNLDVAEQHMKAGIPVYLVWPTEQFINQIILKAEKPIVLSVNETIPEPSFPIVFEGDPSQPKKFDAMHCFMKIFQTYRNPFLFSTASSSTTVSSAPSCLAPPSGSSGPICDTRGKTRASGPLSSKQPSQRKKIQSLQSTRDKFADLSGPYALLPIPMWSTANDSIDQNSERSQQREERVRRSQSEPNTNTSQDYNKGYAFPDLALLVFASVTRQSTYFRQWEHCRDGLIYRISSSTSNATPVHSQVWRELLTMPFKKESTKTTKAHDIMLEMMGTALQVSGTETILRVPLATQDQPFDIERGCYLVWELCELNFRLELLGLDAYLTRSAHTSTQDDADFRLQRQNTILKLFPEESIVPSTGSCGCSLASSVWQDRCAVLKAFRNIMQQWDVPLAVEAKGLLGPSGRKVSLKVEKALAAHYAQTFFDCFGRPPVLPRIRPSHQQI
ncbi:uncharacterized protein EV420DRAFT_1639133 [Desarmillaria tabescens]|uniref:Uncharacterized protein n=1 Tax=Armillaria tabescens TaxID=1929756 RepID=A0AA39NCD0_ARMTA|nr:uncharacterized protein EV420DRAFT_1639133 [Desarmillaria tabescens]KAK0463042.1 hypothetical protein EV420DRAFT_1639133 [Desarmillaria tabescens]